MDRGWGLTLDSDTLRLFSPNNTTGAAVHRAPTGFLKLIGQNSRPRVADVVAPMFSSAHLGHRHSDEERLPQETAASPPLSAGEQRAAVVKEVDFFLADSKNRSSPAHEPSAAAAASASAVKKESEAFPNVNVRTKSPSIFFFFKFPSSENRDVS